MTTYRVRRETSLEEVEADFVFFEGGSIVFKERTDDVGTEPRLVVAYNDWVRLEKE